MIQMYNQQGITDNYPQYTTNFWGDAGNNYGFGSSNISSAISAHPVTDKMRGIFYCRNILWVDKNNISDKIIGDI